MSFINNYCLDALLIRLALEQLHPLFAWQNGLRMGKNYVISRILEPRGVCNASIIELKVFAVLSLSHIEYSRFDFSLSTSSDLLIWSLIKAFNGETAIITGWIGNCSVSRELTFAEKKVQAANGRLWIFRIPYPVPSCLQTLYLFRFNIDIPVAAFDDRGLKAAIKHGRSRTRKVCLVLMLIKICGDKTFRNRDPSWVFFLLGDMWPAFSRVSLSLAPWGRLGENPGNEVAVIPVPKAMYLLITLPHLTLLKSMKWITKSELLIMTTNFKDQLSSFYLL